MKYEFIFNETDLLNYQPYTAGKSPTYTAQDIMISEIEDFIFLADHKGIDYQLLIDDNLVTVDLPVQDEFILDISNSVDGHFRKAFILHNFIRFGNAIKRSALRVMVRSYSPEGDSVVMAQEIFNLAVDQGSTINVGGEDVSQYDYLYNMWKQDPVATMRYVVEDNDARGTFNDD